MISDSLKQRLKPILLMQKLMSFAFVMSIIILCVIAFTVSDFAKTSSAKEVSGLVRGFIIFLAFAAGIFSIAVNRYMFSSTRVKMMLTESGFIGQGASIPGPMDMTTENQYFWIIKKSFNLWIVSMALNESISIFGFLLATLSNQPQMMLPYALVSITLILAMFPKYDVVVEKIAKVPALYA